MRVVIYEPDPTGHHFAYLSHVIDPLSKLASDLILLTSPPAARSAEFEHHLGRLADRFTVDVGIQERPRARNVRQVWRQLAMLQRAVHRLRPDHLYVAYGDDLAQIAALKHMQRRCWNESIESEVLLLRGGYRYPARSLIAGVLKRMSPWLLRRGPWNWLHHLNPDDLEIIRDSDGAFAHRCFLMPDPVEPPSPLSKLEARRALKLPEEGRYIGCIGVINRTKGVDLLLAAFRASRAELRANDRLLLSGPIDESLRPLIYQECAEDLVRGRLFVIDRNLTGEEIGTAVAALDVVATPYPRHLHSSSIVIRAAAGSRPVLANAIGWMKRTVQQFALGTTFDVTDQVAFRGAIVKSLDESAGFCLMPAARRFATFHSTENFSRHWTKRLRERLGLPEESLVSWEG